MLTSFFSLLELTIFALKNAKMKCFNLHCDLFFFFFSEFYEDHKFNKFIAITRPVFIFSNDFIMSHGCVGIWLTLLRAGSPRPFPSSQAFLVEGLPQPQLFLLTLAETQM